MNRGTFNLLVSEDFLHDQPPIFSLCDPPPFLHRAFSSPEPPHFIFFCLIASDPSCPVLMFVMLPLSNPLTLGVLFAYFKFDLIVTPTPVDINMFPLCPLLISTIRTWLTQWNRRTPYVHKTELNWIIGVLFQTQEPGLIH